MPEREGSGRKRTVVEDDVKESSLAAPTAEGSGLSVIMATGDDATTAKAVAERLGITGAYCEVKPRDKLALVARLIKEGSLRRHQRRIVTTL